MGEPMSGLSGRQTIKETSHRGGMKELTLSGVFLARRADDASPSRQMVWSARAERARCYVGRSGTPGHRLSGRRCNLSSPLYNCKSTRPIVLGK